MKNFWASHWAGYLHRMLPELSRSILIRSRKLIGESRVLSSDFAELGLALWTLLVRVTNSAHNRLCVDARHQRRPCR